MRRGYTLVEFMITMLVVALLAAMAIPAYQRVQYNRKENRIHQLQQELKAKSLTRIRQHRADSVIETWFVSQYSITANRVLFTLNGEKHDIPLEQVDFLNYED